MKNVHHHQVPGVPGYPLAPAHGFAVNGISASPWRTPPLALESCTVHQARLPKVTVWSGALQSHLPHRHGEVCHEPSPLYLIAIGRGVLHLDPLVDDQPVLLHGDVVASDHVLLELHFQEVIKKTNMRYSGDYQLNLFDLKNIV